MAEIGNLPIVVEQGAPLATASAALALARALNLTAYDASYLELAARLGLPLASQDSRLKTAAAQIGVPLYDPDADDSPNGQDPT